jgi:hypothetical protein
MDLDFTDGGQSDVISLQRVLHFRGLRWSESFLGRKDISGCHIGCIGEVHAVPVTTSTFNIDRLFVEQRILHAEKPIVQPKK